MKTIVSTLFCLFLLNSCNIMHCPNKETFLQSYADFADKVKVKNDKDNKEWTSVDNEFKDYVDRCYAEFRNELSLKEKKQFWTNTLKFYLHRYDGDLDAAYNHAEDNLSDEFNKDLKLLQKEAQLDIGNVIKELFKDDIKKGVDQLLEAVNEIGQEVKDAIDEPEQ